jgi:hypothetical protein
MWIAKLDEAAGATRQWQIRTLLKEHSMAKQHQNSGQRGQSTESEQMKPERPQSERSSASQGQSGKPTKEQQAQGQMRPADQQKHPGASSSGSNQGAQRHHKESQAGQLSTANDEESPKTNPSEDERGESFKRGALDTQYDTGSDKPDKSGAQSPKQTNPGSSEKSTGADRDTMSGSRPGGRS